MSDALLEFSEGCGGILEKSLPWGRYGYLLELHNGTLCTSNLKRGLCTFLFIVADPRFFVGEDTPVRNGLTGCLIHHLREGCHPPPLPLDLPLHYHCRNIRISNKIAIKNIFCYEDEFNIHSRKLLRFADFI